MYRWVDLTHLKRLWQYRNIVDAPSLPPFDWLKQDKEEINHHMVFITSLLSSHWTSHLIYYCFAFLKCWKQGNTYPTFLLWCLRKTSVCKWRSIKLLTTAQCLHSTFKVYHKDENAWRLLELSPAQKNNLKVQCLIF